MSNSTNNQTSSTDEWDVPSLARQSKESLIQRIILLVQKKIFVIDNIDWDITHLITEKETIINNCNNIKNQIDEIILKTNKEIVEWNGKRTANSKHIAALHLEIQALQSELKALQQIESLGIKNSDVW